MRANRVLAAAGLAMSATFAQAQITVDGQKDAAYGAALYVAQNPTQFGDAVGGGDPCDPNDLGGDPAAVTTGMEFAIPLASIGSPGGSFKMMAMITSGGYDDMSNQVIPGMPAGTPGQGAPAATDFNTVAGQQWVEITPVSVGTAPTLDGTLDSSYGAAIALQTNRSSYGDNSDPAPDSANGSELDGLYVVENGGTLFVFISGVLESNFNKLSILFDTEGGGQNTMAGDNPDVDFNGLNNLAGLTFDAGFEADYWVAFTNGGTPNTGYINFARLNFGADVGGPSGYQGSTFALNIDGPLNGTNAAGMAMTFDSSATGGVLGSCPAQGEDFASGSEIDQMFGIVDPNANRLYLLFAGNLQTGGGAISSNSGNKLMIFVDADESEGQPRLLDNNQGISYGNLRNMGATSPLGDDGLTFDDGVTPDYWMQAKTAGNGATVGQALDSQVLRTNGPLMTLSGDLNDYAAFDSNFKSERVPVPYDGPLLDPLPSTTGGDALCNYGPRTTQMDQVNLVTGLLTAYVDNSNREGMTDTSVAGADQVTTGFEVSIDLDELGWDGVSPVKVAAFITGEDGTYASNQVLGGLPAAYDTRNLGEDFATNMINFANIDGDQFVIVPVASGDTCPADLSPAPDGDGQVNTNDFFQFLTYYQAQNLAADFFADGMINTNDFFAFLAAYQDGLNNGC